MVYSNAVRSLIRNILVILPILGLTWVFGVIAINSDTVAFQFIFAIANSLQVRVKVPAASSLCRCPFICLSYSGVYIEKLHA